MSEPDIVVLRQKIHGMSATEYADILRDRLPDYTVFEAETPKEEQEYINEAPIVTGFSIDPENITPDTNLKWFACVFAGTGHLDREALTEKGVTITNASGVHGPNIAEQVIGYMLMFARRLHKGFYQQEDQEWRSYPTTELKGSTATIIGLGAIGTAVVDRLHAFDIETIGVRYTPSKGGPTDTVLGFDDDLHDAFANSEYVILASPLTETTRGMIDSEVFRTLPSDAVVINVGRGPLIQTDDLVSAIQRNSIKGAALDVTDPEPLPQDHQLWNFKNVIITPHNAGHTPHYWDRMADILEENISKIETTGTYDELRNQVN
ncbi:MAG: D-2-hydroxyacid dehydrogenase [Halobacteriaceae archaeon]